MVRRSNQRRQFRLSSPVVIDTDCLSSFLWAKQGELVPRILQQAIYVPEPVVLEVGRLLASKKYAWIVKQLDGLFSSGEYIRLVVGITDPSMAEYAFLTHPKSVKPFGDGEAAA